MVDVYKFKSKEQKEDRKTMKFEFSSVREVEIDVETTKHRIKTLENKIKELKEILEMAGEDVN